MELDKITQYQNIVLELSDGREIKATVPVFCQVDDELSIVGVRVTPPPRFRAWDILGGEPHNLTNHSSEIGKLRQPAIATTQMLCGCSEAEALAPNHSTEWRCVFGGYPVTPAGSNPASHTPR